METSIKTIKSKWAREDGCGLFDNIILFYLNKLINEDKENEINWGLLAQNPNTPLKVFEKYHDKFQQKDISKSPALTLEYVHENYSQLDWNSLLSNPVLDFSKKETLKFIPKFNTISGWENLSKNPTLPFDLIKKYEEYWLWNLIFANSAFDFSNHEIAAYFEEKFSTIGGTNSWYWISKNPTLPLEFIDKYAENVKWGKISKNISLDFSKEEDRNFVEKYNKLFYWWRLAKNPKVSIEFIQNYHEDKYYAHVLENPNTSIDFIESNFDKYNNWEIQLSNPNLTLGFIKKFQNRLASNFWKFEKLWANPLNLHPIVLARNKKIYSTQLQAELIEYIAKKQFTHSLIIYKLCVHEFDMIIRDDHNGVNSSISQLFNPFKRHFKLCLVELLEKVKLQN